MPCCKAASSARYADGSRKGNSMMVIRNVRLVANGLITPCDIVVENGRIAAIGRFDESGRVIDAHGLYLSHGFIDIHVHGGGGHDFMDATREAWHGAGALHLSHGTTAMVPTTLAAGKKELLSALRIFNLCSPGFADGPKLLGVHVEGPYLSPKWSGAQDPEYIRNPEPEEYEEILAVCPGILRWTAAPELPGAFELGDRLTEYGVVPCIGHSDASYEEVCGAMLHGYRHVTHLYSAMSTIVRKMGFRHAGIVESAYLLDGLSSEVIADGCHLPGCLLQMAYRFIGPDRLCLITDAMRAAGQTEGESILGSLENGQRVILEDGVAKMPDRQAFAGSICTADRLVRNMVQLAGASLPDAVKMITETPARVLGLSGQTGSVAVGRAADLVLFDENIQVQMVMVDGEVRWTQNGFDAGRSGSGQEGINYPIAIERRGKSEKIL